MVMNAIDFHLLGKGTHVFLSNQMENSFARQYENNPPALRKTVALSNAAFIDDRNPRQLNCNAAIRIGFISNISKSKGIDTFLDTLEKLDAEGIDFEALIAGPFGNQREKREILPRILARRNAAYKGALHDQEKEDFYDSIDVLLFPSRYKNEAEPLVIYEAMCRGIVVIANEIGCIKDAIDIPQLVVANKNEFADQATEHVLTLESGETLRDLSQQCRRQFQIRKLEGVSSLALLIENLRSQAL